ncbi:hypothetical protein COCMIDRAFT_83440 [Bipolaris oryzae ATCC 44560]|uniref:Uncharacterized protein n=1 Tax=Bipolaris oryzae ATCC 44560 TaxID=930090 RepID=W6ZIW2_COCMI|nr:uncharacterized protein COCMIDRAFT_83440 [Bipolaris oryzae ATCC 44560]EUC49950.1 hypothetical protein COCMIDRAFT_83440 [Bipolaris oryzae ATCC 44560]
MRFLQIIPAVFAASTLAAKFENFVDTSCQRYSADYKLITVAEQEKLIVDSWAKTPTSQETSRAFSPKGSCPSNADDTYKWITVPQWNDVPTRFGRPGGGSIAVVYFNETDTYHVCRYLASVQPNGYAGFCK